MGHYLLVMASGTSSAVLVKRVSSISVPMIEAYLWLFPVSCLSFEGELGLEMYSVHIK